MNEIAVMNDFDYSAIDTTTKEFLEERANIIYGIQSKSAYEIGKQLARAQEKLSQNRYGCFEEWYRSLGFKTTKAYEYINHFKFISSQSEELNIKKFEELPSKLQAEMSKPSAIPEVNQAVFNGDVTTHKEYKELERRLKLKDQALEAVKGELERVKLTKATEKVIEKEVIPDDYQATQELNKRLLAKNKELSDSEQAANERMKSIESQLKELMNQRQEVDEKSAKYDELTRAIEQSQGQLDSYQKQVSAYRHTINFLEKGNNFLANFGGVAFLDIKPALNNPKVRTELETFLTMLNSLSRSVSEILEQDDVIEGEIL
ncbi:MAG: hypothetical protein E7B87_00735 [Streptococcus salivarius]|nr:hypothetical protein [Streptococcus salivarius]MDU2859096.1 hypothetical protein [Streptococcus salivarius]